MFFIFPIWGLKSYGRYRIFNYIIESGLKRNDYHSKNIIPIILSCFLNERSTQVGTKKKGNEDQISIYARKIWPSPLLSHFQEAGHFVLQSHVSTAKYGTIDISVNCNKILSYFGALPLSPNQEPRSWAKSYFILRQIATVHFRVSTQPPRKGWNDLLIATLSHTTHSIWQCILFKCALHPFFTSEMR